MKLMFYPKLAWDNMRKNKRLYGPCLLTGAVMVMMCYILSFLANSPLLNGMKGGGVLGDLLPFGVNVIAIFSAIFLFYSNSFLMRQRTREFGLYNILGMDKWNLSRVMFWETAFSAAAAIGGGLAMGIMLSKLAELGLLRLITAEVNYEMRIDWDCALQTAKVYLAIYGLLLVSSMIKVRRSNPLALLGSATVGEKTPKANWVLAVLGVVLLGFAYYIALSVKNPLDAMVWFFVAVILVIAATYLLFISGSVALCRLLQKSKSYYYKPNHFVSVSTMVYRMKRNGAGLASICILLTMILVMLSSTMSLYLGIGPAMESNFPREIVAQIGIPSVAQYTPENVDLMRERITRLVPERENELEYTRAEAAFAPGPDGTLLLDCSTYLETGEIYASQLGELWIVPLEDYNRLMGTDNTLEPGECLIWLRRTSYSGDTLALEGGVNLQVKGTVESIGALGTDVNMSVLPALCVITPEFDQVVGKLSELENPWEESYVSVYWNHCFDVPGGADEEIQAYDLLSENMSDIVIRSEDDGYSYRLSSRAEDINGFFEFYGGLFFIGILLGLVFLFAAVLIIYYKQVSEGLEDQKRFDVMQKVGMTTRDIRKTINSQVLTVFFTPLVTAGIHLAFAFPIVWKLLQMFYATNLGLVIGVTVGCYLVFGLAYALVYKITSNSYFSIVSGGKND